MAPFSLNSWEHGMAGIPLPIAARTPNAPNVYDRAESLVVYKCNLFGLSQGPDWLKWERHDFHAFMCSHHTWGPFVLSDELWKTEL